MKNKLVMIRAFAMAVALAAGVWALFAFLCSPAHQLPQMARDVLAVAFLFFVVSVLSMQDQDDDDWAGQY